MASASEANLNKWAHNGVPARSPHHSLALLHDSGLDSEWRAPWCMVVRPCKESAVGRALGLQRSLEVAVFVALVG